MTQLLRLLVSSLLILLLACEKEEPKAKSPSNEFELAWVSNRMDNQLGIFIKDMTSEEATPLFLEKEYSPYNLNWDPSQKNMVFVSRGDLYLLDTESRAARPLTSGDAKEGQASFQPDGINLVYKSTRDDIKGEFYQQSIKDTLSKRLTENLLYDMAPAVSPDGKRIASCQELKQDASVKSVFTGISIMDLSSGESKVLTAAAAQDCMPDWSPNGKKIAFHRCEKGSCQIYVMNADGSELNNISNDEFDSRWPKWSPDGEWIAYTTSRNGQSDIYLMRADGSMKQAFTSDGGRDEIAVWRRKSVKQNP
ncbi:MAG: hypothetical protein AAFY71_05400 [Bacteroidota bacterium]